MSVLVQTVDLGPTARGWCTGRADGPDPDVGRAGNLAASRPHQPARLAADRRDAFAQMGLDPHDVHFLRQVHGADVAEVDRGVARGAILDSCDAVVTAVPGRPLAVLTADCVPVLLASAGAVGAVHAGRRGLLAGVVEAALDALDRHGGLDDLRAVIGPAIRGCCYEVPDELRDAVASRHPVTAAETASGTPALDLPAGVAAILKGAGAWVEDLGACTSCASDRYFSHRRDPRSGRQAAVVVRVEGSDP